METFSAGKGNVEVTIEDAHGHPVPAEVRFNNDRNLTYTVSYTPRNEGAYKITVKYSGRDVPKSPFKVNVEGKAADPTKVTASGPGLQPDGVCVGRSTYFDITATGG